MRYCVDNTRIQNVSDEISQLRFFAQLFSLLSFFSIETTGGCARKYRFPRNRLINRLLCSQAVLENSLSLFLFLVKTLEPFSKVVSLRCRWCSAFLDSFIAVRCFSVSAAVPVAAALVLYP